MIATPTLITAVVCPNGFIHLTAETCGICPKNNFCDQDGIQHACPLLSTSSQMSGTFAACKCPTSYIMNGTYNCRPCSVGYACSSMSSEVMCLAGTYAPFLANIAFMREPKLGSCKPRARRKSPKGRL